MDRDEEAIRVTGWHSTCWQGKKPLERKEPMATDQRGLKKHLWVCQVWDVGSWPGPCCLIRPKTVLIMSPHWHFPWFPPVNGIKIQLVGVTFQPPCWWTPICCLDLISSAPAWPLGVPLTHLHFLPTLSLLPAVVPWEMNYVGILEPFPPAGPSSDVTSSMKWSPLSPSCDLFAATPGLLQRPSAPTLWYCYLGPCFRNLLWMLISWKAGAMSIHFCFPLLTLSLAQFLLNMLLINEWMPEWTNTWMNESTMSWLNY